MVETVNAALQYTYTNAPKEEDFGYLLQKLGSRVDDVRGVFRNVGEKYFRPGDNAKTFVRAVKYAKSDEHLAKALEDYQHDADATGLYPFESLKQIRLVIQRLGFGDAVTADRAMIAREAIEKLWRVLRAELLKELDRDFPEFPDTPYTKRR